MSIQLSKELQDQIEREAIDGQVNNPASDFKKGYNHGYGLGYEAAGEKYAELWQAAEADRIAARKLLDEVSRKHEAGLLPDRFVYEKIKSFLYPSPNPTPDEQA